MDGKHDAITQIYSVMVCIESVSASYSDRAINAAGKQASKLLCLDDDAGTGYRIIRQRVFTVLHTLFRRKNNRQFLSCCDFQLSEVMQGTSTS